MEKYNKIYSASNDKTEIRLSPSLKLVWESFPSNGHILDLGCGQGHDSLYLAKKRFKVTAIDSANVAIDQIKAKKEEFKLDNLELICGDTKDFIIEEDKYQVIICRHVLNFLNKENALELVENIKNKIKVNSYIIIELFTKNDPSFSSDRKFASYFEEQELLKIFYDYKIIYYLENIILDPGHPGHTAPHKHGIARIIAKK